MRRAAIKLAIQISLIVALVVLFAWGFAGSILTGTARAPALDGNTLTVAYRSDQVGGIVVHLYASAREIRFRVEVTAGNVLRPEVYLTGTGSGERFVDCLRTDPDIGVRPIPAGDPAISMLRDADRIRKDERPSLDAIGVTLPFGYSMVVGSLEWVECSAEPHGVITDIQARRDVALPKLTVAGMLPDPRDYESARKARTAVCAEEELTLAPYEQLDTLRPEPVTSGDDVWNELWRNTLDGRTSVVGERPAPANIWRNCSETVDCPASFVATFGRCATGLRLPQVNASFHDLNVAADRDKLIFLGGALVGLIGGLVVEVIQTGFELVGLRAARQSPAPAPSTSGTDARRTLRRLRALRPATPGHSRLRTGIQGRNHRLAERQKRRRYRT